MNVLYHIVRIADGQGMTLADVARKANLPYRTIYNWKDHMPAADRLAIVARVLGTTSEDLLKGIID